MFLMSSVIFCCGKKESFGKTRGMTLGLSSGKCISSLQHSSNTCSVGVSECSVALVVLYSASDLMLKFLRLSL